MAPTYVAISALFRCTSVSKRALRRAKRRRRKRAFFCATCSKREITFFQLGRYHREGPPGAALSQGPLRKENSNTLSPGKKSYLHNVLANSVFSPSCNPMQAYTHIFSGRQPKRLRCHAGLRLYTLTWCKATYRSVRTIIVRHSRYPTNVVIDHPHSLSTHSES